MCQADEPITGDAVSREGALQSGGIGELSMGIVAKLMKKQTLKYVIHMEPGQGFIAKSLGEHILAIVDLLATSAADLGVDLTATISELKYEGDAITIGLLLVHTPKGQTEEPCKGDERTER
jgi:hypothetical protein